MNYEAKLQPKKTISIDKILLARHTGRSNDYYSVEHVWATGHRAEIGVNDRPVDYYEKRRLGNFVLLELGINVQGSNQDIEAKINVYGGKNDTLEASDLKHVRFMCNDAKRVIESMSGKNKTRNYYLERHRAINDRQEDRYCKFAADRWSIKSYLGFKHYATAAREAIDDDG